MQWILTGINRVQNDYKAQTHTLIRYIVSVVVTAFLYSTSSRKLPRGAPNPTAQDHGRTRGNISTSV